MTTATVKKPPPKSTARKGNPANAEYEDKAKAMLRYAMSQKGVTPDELSKLLAKIGVEISAGGVANKISRGGFSSAFLLQCMEVLGIQLAPVEK